MPLKVHRWKVDEKFILSDFWPLFSDLRPKCASPSRRYHLNTTTPQSILTDSHQQHSWTQKQRSHPTHLHLSVLPLPQFTHALFLCCVLCRCVVLVMQHLWLVVKYPTPTCEGFNYIVLDYQSTQIAVYSYILSFPSVLFNF